MFYQRLSKFFAFCENKVDDIALSLSTIYHYEVSNSGALLETQSLFEVSLRNRYSDLIFRVQRLKVHLVDLEGLLIQYHHQ
jgi:hypothetical protein